MQACGNAGSTSKYYVITWGIYGGFNSGLVLLPVFHAFIQ